MLAVQRLATGIRALGAGSEDTERRAAGALSSEGGTVWGQSFRDETRNRAGGVGPRALCAGNSAAGN